MVLVFELFVGRPDLRRMHPRHPNARPALVLVLVSVLLTGCVPMTENSWRFSLTRVIYAGSGSGGSTAAAEEEFSGWSGGSYARLGLLGLILIWPILVDIVLLPVTWPHDVLTE